MAGAFDATLKQLLDTCLMGLRYDEAVAQALFHGVQKMRESSTYQAILNEGRVEGRVEGAIAARQEVLLTQLHERFGAVPPEMEARVRATTDVVKLGMTLRQIVHIKSLTELPL